MQHGRRSAGPVAGVDGCRGGWAVAVVDGERVALRRVELAGVGTVVHDRSLTTVAVDMPIGLPEIGPRACDRLARALLPGRASTVYPAPRRPVLDCASYAEARALMHRLGGPSLSAQAWGIVAGVRELDRHLSAADEGRVVEAHPELAFAGLAGGRPLPPKQTAEGRAARRALITAWRPDAAAALDAGVVPEIDGLDALACAWMAGRFAAGEADILTDGSRDARGLLMRIAR